jgi:hypothetical protein
LVTYTDKPEVDKSAIVATVDFKNDASPVLLEGQFIRSDVTSNVRHATDSAWWLSGEYEPSDLWTHEAVLFRYGDSLDVNDFGFVKRTNRKQFEYEATRRWADLTEVSWVRDAELSLQTEHRDTLAGDDLPDQFGIGVAITLNDTSELEFESEYLTSGLDDLLTRGNHAVSLPAGYESVLTYKSHHRGKFQSEIGALFGKEGYQGDFYGIRLGLEAQITDHLSAEVDVESVDADSWLVWDSENVIGDYQRRESTFSLNMSYVRGRHELRLKGEAVAINANLNSSLQVATDGRVSPVDTGLADFTVSEFAMQLRYRYSLGRISELFLVYSRGGEFEGGRVSGSLGSIFRDCS